MPLSEETAFRLLPESRPERLPIRGQQAERLAELEAQFGRDGLLPRILAWHVLLASTLRERYRSISDSFTALDWDNEFFELAAGYVALGPRQYTHPLIDAARHNEDYFFGAVLFDYRGKPEPVFDQALDLGSWGDDRLSGIPVLHVPVATVLHAAPNVHHATSTCWAAAPKHASADHILTAAHCVGWRGKGHSVAFDGGLSGSIHDCCTYPVDAAVISPNFLPPNLTSQIQVEPVPVQSEPFLFEGSKSGVVNGKVALVQVLPGVAHPYSPQRIYLDTAGQPGDSGAMVRSNRTGRAMSIYTGTLKGPGVTYIHSQGMEQACTLLDLELWE